MVLDSAQEMSPGERHCQHQGEGGRSCQGGAGWERHHPLMLIPSWHPEMGGEPSPRLLSQESLDARISALPGPFFSWQQFTM